MISFWVDGPGAFGIENYRVGRGEAIWDRFAVRRYDWREPSLEVRAGPHIFSALDQLGEAEREAVGQLYDQLATQQPGYRPLNDPRRCRLRQDLLHVLAEAGLNSFRAYPVDQARQIERFPVFVRQSAGHGGSLTALLDSPPALRRALRALRLRGFRYSDLLIVEFCDTSQNDGIFRKYAAFRVGDAIVATHMMASKYWLVKSDSNTRNPELAREGLAYAESNPHEAWMRRVFTLAEIDYGRLDFGVLNGRPQAWEINLNPTIGRGPGAPDRPVDPEIAGLVDQAREVFHSRLRNAFAALDRTPAPGTLLLRLERELLEQVGRERSKIRQRDLAWSSLRKLYHHPRIGAPLRALSRLLPRG